MLYVNLSSSDQLGGSSALWFLYLSFNPHNPVTSRGVTVQVTLLLWVYDGENKLFDLVHRATVEIDLLVLVHRSSLQTAHLAESPLDVWSVEILRVVSKYESNSSDNCLFQRLKIPGNQLSIQKEQIFKGDSNCYFLPISSIQQLSME